MSTLPSIYFRTDGNTKIATGHIMRCLAIARACVKQNARVTFIVSDEESRSLLRERFTAPEEFDICCLHSDYRRMYEELPTLTGYLDAENASIQTSSATQGAQAALTAGKPWIFIDSYFASPAYFAALRPYGLVACLDDLRSFSCDVDLVIHYDTETDSVHYQNAGRKLLGPQYTPLREQFEQPPYTVRTTAQHILLSTGGTDPYGVARHLLENIFYMSDASCRPLQKCDYHVVTDKTNAGYDALLSMSAANPRIHIHEGVTDMAALMASCDLAVSAGGTTLCELCAVGVPTVSYMMAENQRTAVENFSRKGLIPFAGDIRGRKSGQPAAGAHAEKLSALNSSAIASIFSFLTQMSVDVDARKKSSQSMRAFLDGRGAVRIAEALLHP